MHLGKWKAWLLFYHFSGTLYPSLMRAIVIQGSSSAPCAGSRYGLGTFFLSCWQPDIHPAHLLPDKACHPASKLLIFHLACQIEAPGTVHSRRLFFCFGIILAAEISELPFPLPHFPCSSISVRLLQPLSSRALPSAVRSADEVLLLPCVIWRCYSHYLKVKLRSEEISGLIFRSSNCLLLPWGVVLDIMARNDVTEATKLLDCC